MKTEPYPHQEKDYLRFRDESGGAIFWEMGLGKSKLMCDVASWLHSEGKIEQLMILAPKSVYRNWTDEEIPRHLWSDYISLAYPRKRGAAESLLKLTYLRGDDSGRLHVLTMSYSSLRTDHGLAFASNACTLRKTMIVADESTILKAPKNKTTRAAKRVRRLCHRAFILTGTPTAQSPFDLHSQIEFALPDFWAVRGLKTLGAFKSEFGIFRNQNFGGRRVSVVCGYRELDRLSEIIRPVSTRRLKDDAGVNLPPKIYVTREFELTAEQRLLCNDLRRNLYLELDGSYVETPLVISKMLRMQQICSGFVGAYDSYESMLNDEPRKLRDCVTPENNPRIRMVSDLLTQLQGKVIVWSRFTREIELLMEATPDAVRYDGKTPDALRESNLRRFRDESDDEARVLVANIKSLSRGVTLTCAKAMIYCTNDYSLENRLQSEDRIHRIGQDQTVTIVDVVSDCDVDRGVVRALRKKYDISAAVNGDQLREWINE